MERSLTMLDAQLGAFTGSPDLVGYRAVIAAEPAAPSPVFVNADTIRAFAVEQAAMLPPLPADIGDLLMSTIRFCEAIMRVDLAGVNCETEGPCLDALAAVKQSLRKITWSRALE
jgi:hypothetical protein